MIRRHVPGRRAFTLVELLVVIGIIAVLVAILLPALSRARASANTAKCLSNMRNMQVAHWMYVNDHKGRLVQAGLSHGGHTSSEPVAWVTTLQPYFQDHLLHRCPADHSPHWPGQGTPVPGTAPQQFRRTSYGINNFLDHHLCPWGGPYLKINQVRSPAATVQFVEMTEVGEFAGADHPHVENWAGNAPVQAARHLATSVHGGPRQSWTSVANYGFLDGHAETLRFRDAFESFEKNKFDPAVAQ
jgi:prepilin-type N-terminal cleavage/methylation domain-containing protein/prepilin-type processing-associated H-X9-DG protein